MKKFIFSNVNRDYAEVSISAETEKDAWITLKYIVRDVNEWTLNDGAEDVVCPE